MTHEGIVAFLATWMKYDGWKATEEIFEDFHCGFVATAKVK